MLYHGKKGRPRGSVDRQGKARAVTDRATASYVRSFGKRLRALRIERDISVDELAAAIGHNAPAAVLRIELGHRQPKLETIFRLSYALGILPGELMP